MAKLYLLLYIILGLCQSHLNSSCTLILLIFKVKTFSDLDDNHYNIFWTHNFPKRNNNKKNIDFKNLCVGKNNSQAFLRFIILLIFFKEN